MAAVAATARLFRSDTASWSRLTVTSTLPGAAVVVLGSYLLLAFDRFGLQGFTEARATIRMLLTGVYGWLGLAVGAWLIARFAWQKEPSLEPVVRLFGHAHIPLLVVAAAIQFISVTLQTTGVVLWVALPAVLLWMPAQMLAAARVSLDLERPQAVLAVLGPYVAWVVIVGRWLETQLGHLL